MTIQPRTLKGFRDYLPESMIPREQLIDTAKRVYRSFGFSPIDTPALEYLEILLGKGGEETDRQLYKFTDHGGREVGMRFDLTVPLARFVAQHAAELGLPFKRYHVATVWRGESPQRGRFREFMQCDFDTVGSLGVAADVETALVIHELLSAIGFERFRIRINNRQVLNGMLERLGLAERATDVLRALDKLAKAGPQVVKQELQDKAAASEQQAVSILQLAALGGTTDQILSELDPLVRGSEQGEAGVQRLRDVVSCAARAGVPEQRLQLDVSIARGLDYYTGLIYETFLDDLPEIGSVCSGGRYDDLAGLFTKQLLPGVGASLGLDRLLAAMESLGMIEPVRTPAPVMIVYFERDRLGDYLQLAARIRAAGIGVEVYPEPKKVGQQLKYADRRGFRLALIMGQDELEKGVCQVKDLRDGSQDEVPASGDALPQRLADLLAS